MLQKKAQGLSMNVIIIAAIALIVLVVLIMIFTGRMGLFTGGIKTCPSMGGFCVAGANVGAAFTSCETETQDLNADTKGDGKLVTEGGLMNKAKYDGITTKPVINTGGKIGCSAAQYCCVGLKKVS